MSDLNAMRIRKWIAQKHSRSSCQYWWNNNANNYNLDEKQMTKKSRIRSLPQVDNNATEKDCS